MRRWYRDPRADAVGYGARVLRPVVVVVVCGLAPCWVACPPAPVEQPEACRQFVACYLTPQDDGASGYERLAAASATDVGERELSCYAGFLDGDGAKEDGGAGVDGLLAPMRRSYSEGGSCWVGGYAPVADGVDSDGLDRKYRRACTAHCELELQAECRRRALPDVDPDLLACADDADIETWCQEHTTPEQRDDARCPGADDDVDDAGEGEGEGEE